MAKCITFWQCQRYLWWLELVYDCDSFIWPLLNNYSHPSCVNNVLNKSHFITKNSLKKQKRIFLLFKWIFLMHVVAYWLEKNKINKEINIYIYTVIIEWKWFNLSVVGESIKRASHSHTNITKLLNIFICLVQMIILLMWCNYIFV